MKFWRYSLTALASLLAAVSASGPTDGEAAADPNSAVVKLTADDFSSFITENPLVLAEFFAPWCGYCKVLGPEFSKAADELNVSHPSIKLAQIDCTEEEALCQEQGIKGYPSLKVIHGSADAIEDYEGQRTAEGIVDFMVQQTLPVVQKPETIEALKEILTTGERPVIVEIVPKKVKKSAKKNLETFETVAKSKRKDASFVSITGEELVSEFEDLISGAELKEKTKSPQYVIVRPNALDDATLFSSEEPFTAESLTSFIETEIIPYFGEINRDTYMLYMNSPLPIGYYFYNTVEEKAKVEETFNKLGKQHRGKINFVGLDAVQFGRHAEILNMNPEVIPLFAIQKVADNLKYGIDQTKFPEGPSIEAIEQFVADYFDDKLVALTKSEDLPTPEEVAATPVVKLVGHNHADIINDTTKDVFVKYYAPWCGHCKTLAPKWEELAEVYGSNKPEAEVIIAHIDHTANDVATPFKIEGYPTLVLYPANGEIDEATGLRSPIFFEKAREVDDLIEFLNENTGNKVDGDKLRKALEEAKKSGSSEKREESAPAADEDDEEDSDDEEAHDEL